MATLRDKQAWAAYPPVRHVREISKMWPAWRKTISTLLQQRQQGQAPWQWPDACYLPVMAAYVSYTQAYPEFLSAAQSGALPFEEYSRPTSFAGAYIWEQAKICCRFDADLYSALASQPLDGQLPTELFYRLPAWAVYIELPGVIFDNEIVDGMTVFVDWRLDLQRFELQMMLYQRGKIWPRLISLPFAETLDKSLEMLQADDERFAKAGAQDAKQFALLCNIILYLCTDNADVSGLPTGRRFAPAAQSAVHVELPEKWDVGFRIGSALRRYRNASSGEHTGATHLSPRPHVRRAHWHHFWAGSQNGERHLILHWLPPIPVRINIEDELPVVIRPVKEHTEDKTHEKNK